MSATARCRTCNEQISFTVGNPVELGFHMIDRHGTGSVVQFSIHEDDAICPSRKSISTSKCTGDCQKLRRENAPYSTHTRTAGLGGQRRRNDRGLYKTTLETWYPGACYMICPTCNKEVRPLIRSQQNKVAYTSLGATFLLSCWPFCFLFPSMHKCAVDIYCPICKLKLGVYDTSTGMYKIGENVIMVEKPIPQLRTM